MLGRHNRDLRRLIGEIEESAGPHASGNEVDRLVDAMLSAPRAQSILSRIVGAKGDISGLQGEIRRAMLPLLARVIQGQGGRVGGISVAAARTGLRDIAQGESADAPSIPLV